MELCFKDRCVHTDEQGYLDNPDDWTEDFAAELAKHDGVTLFDDHWGLILYFREYYHQTHTVPTMRKVMKMASSRMGGHYRNARAYANFLYKLFPRDPVRELCKLAGLPRPQADS
jgi:TusE/DsrC/DsvC family sulfur relay protein